MIGKVLFGEGKVMLISPNCILMNAKASANRCNTSYGSKAQREPGAEDGVVVHVDGAHPRSAMC